MRTSAALFVLLALAGCGGSDASTEAYPAAACPVDDAALCGRAAAATSALEAGDVDRLVELSYSDEFRCDELPAELFPDCAPGKLLEGHAFTDGQGEIRILAEARYRAELDRLGEAAVLGVGTCGPDDPERRSYHLAFEGEDRLGSLELVRREGAWRVGMLLADSESGWRVGMLLADSESGWRVGMLLADSESGWRVGMLLADSESGWRVGMLLADSESGWKRQLDDPRAELACGNVQPWGLDGVQPGM